MGHTCVSGLYPFYNEFMMKKVILGNFVKFGQVRQEVGCYSENTKSQPHKRIFDR